MRGLVFGRFPGAVPADYAGPSQVEVAGAWARRLGVPTLWGLAFGHDPDAHALPCGRATRLACEPGGWRLEFAARVPS